MLYLDKRCSTQNDSDKLVILNGAGKKVADFGGNPYGQGPFDIKTFLAPTDSSTKLWHKSNVTFLQWAGPFPVYFLFSSFPYIGR